MHGCGGDEWISLNKLFTSFVSTASKFKDVRKIEHKILVSEYINQTNSTTGRHCPTAFILWTIL